MEISHLYNCTVYLNGGAYIGAAETVKLPDIVQKMAEVSGLGLFGTVELPSGIEAMEASITWNGPYEAALLATNNPLRAVSLMVRGSLEKHTSAGLDSTSAYVATMTVRQKASNQGEFKAAERLMPETVFTVTSYKLEIGGVTMIEFDALSNTYKVANTDVLSAFRANNGQ